MISEKFWKGKRVLITGSDGFLGSNLTKRMIGYGAKVVGLDIRINRKNNLLTGEDYKTFKLIKCDIADFSKLKKIVSNFKPEIIFHLGAEAIVGVCNKDPMRAFKSNIEGTWNILEICRNQSFLKAMVVASSDKAYGSHKILPYKEDAALNGDHPYDASKSCADLIAYTYFHTYGMPVSVTRCGNIYGPGDFNYSRIVPDAIRCAVTGKTLLIRSDGKFTRDYVYVDDIVNGYIMIAEQLQRKGLAGEAFNLSDENPITVLKFINEISRIMGKKVKYRILNQAKYEIKHQYLASGKARKTLGWKPGYSLIEGIERTVKWYEEYFKKRNR